RVHEDLQSRREVTKKFKHEAPEMQPRSLDQPPLTRRRSAAALAKAEDTKIRRRKRLIRVFFVRSSWFRDFVAKMYRVGHTASESLKAELRQKEGLIDLWIAHSSSPL